MLWFKRIVCGIVALLLILLSIKLLQNQIQLWQALGLCVFVGGITLAHIAIFQQLPKYDFWITLIAIGLAVALYLSSSKNFSQKETISASAENIKEELAYVSDKVEELTGKKPSYFRPPFGDYDNELIETAEEMGLQTIQWSVDSLDWKGLSATEITARVTKNVKNGSIVLFHNNSDNILEALPLVLANLINRGYKPVAMSELVYKDGYYIDNNGIQHKDE